MKKRTWLLSALMYAMVIMACFGVLHFMEKATEPSGTEQTLAQGPEPVTADGGNTPEEPEDDEPVRVSTLSQAEEAGHVNREQGYKGLKNNIPSVWTPPRETEIPYVPPNLILAADLHYQSAWAEDGGKAFRLFEENSDGKVIQYLPQLLDAFIDEVIEQKPSALVFGGDNTMNGERMNHEELALKLKRVQDEGIQVLMIPGNHDINHGDAAVYYGDEKTPVPSIDASEFYDLYHEFGFDQALSRDSSSLSYLYALDGRNWLMLLDSCQYDPVNKVEGRLRESTLAWMDEQLARAKEEGVLVIPIAHHNLLSQSRMYTTQCAMENNGEVIDLLQKYRLPLFFSGHLHVQRMRKHKAEPGVPEGAYGIAEIVTDALSIPPCQYGYIRWEEDGSITYETQAVDVSAWARKTGSHNPDLLDFEDWSLHYLERLISRQIRGMVTNLGEDAESSMAATYAEVYMDYYAGRKIDAEGVRSTRGYRWWVRNMPDSYLIRELDAMIEDSDRDNNYLLLPGKQGWLADERD